MPNLKTDDSNLIRIDVLVSKGQYEYIYKAAEFEHTSRSAICRRIIAEWMRVHVLPEHQKEQRDALDRKPHVG